MLLGWIGLASLIVAGIALGAWIVGALAIWPN